MSKSWFCRFFISHCERTCNGKSIIDCVEKSASLFQSRPVDVGLWVATGDATEADVGANVDFSHWGEDIALIWCIDHVTIS